MSNSKSNNEVVVLSNSGTEVSFQVLQDVYNSLTGRKENLDRTYFDCHHLKLNDFINLHTLLAQLFEQYACESSSCSVVVRYSDGRAESFSSFERFKIQAGTRNECVENIEFSYKFLIVLPKTREAKTYKVDFFAMSQIGLEERMNKNEAPEIERRMVADLMRVTARASIDYIDIAVARNIEAQIDEWYRGIPKNSDGFWIKISNMISKQADLLVRGAGYLTLLIAAWFLIVPILDGSVVQLFKALAVFSVGVSVIGMVGHELGMWSGRKLGENSSKSIVELSNCDLEVQKRLSSSTLKVFGYLFLANVGAVLLGLATTVIGKAIGL